MFYSHEVLTNRKYGVATVWLVATLGSKSSLRRITRKQLLDVDVAKACKTIVDPVAPMALRLQGNLLYGVSRVYLQQCGYVLQDAQSAQTSMMLMLRTAKDQALDLDASRARPEQLIFQDDPSFLPEFAIPPPELLADLGLGLDLDFPRSGESQSLTPFGSQHSSQSSHIAGFGLVLPSSSPDRSLRPGFEGDRFALGNNDMLDVHNLLQLDEPDFTFGEDGDIIEFTPGQPAPATPLVTGARVARSDTGASARVRQEHEDGLQGNAQVPVSDQMNIDLPMYGDDLPEAEHSSSAAGQQHGEHSEVIMSSSSAVAPMRRKKRAARAIPRDTRMELRNTEIIEWSTNYLDNMNEAARPKIQHRLLQQAKKNADYYVWGAGVGGLGRDPYSSQGPLGGFMGDNLFELFTGKSRNPKAGSKRERDSGIDEATQEESRRKRPKTVEPEEQLGRADYDEGFFMLGGDEEVELPRDAASALDDQKIFSAMPWNISASKRGSSAILLSGRATMMSEQGRQGSRAGSRMVSASPLLRRSTGHPAEFEALQSFDSDAFGGDEFPFVMPTSDPVQADEQATQLSIRVREALSAEGENFFTFVAEAIIEKRERLKADLVVMSDDLQAQAIVDVEEVTFEELLPPRETSKTIACQGFLMLLSLGTKNMLDVHQPTAFESITMSLTEQAKVLQTSELEGNVVAVPEQDGKMDDISQQGDNYEDDGSSVTEAGDEGAAAEPDDSHFQEQMAACHAPAEDHDSLYDD